MIGDRSHDMVGAKNNGMKGIGVLYGYGSREELLGAGAMHVCATPRRDPRLHFRKLAGGTATSSNAGDRR